jgi:hypothetical protein
MAIVHLKTVLCNIFDSAKRTIFGIYDVMIISALRDLYMNGPAPLFWNGQSSAEICHTMSPLASVSFWEQNEKQCNLQIENKFNTVLYILHYAIYFFLLYRFWCFTNWIFWILCCRALSRRRVRYNDPLLLE